MLLALDIGNSEIKIGLWNAGCWIQRLRRETKRFLEGNQQPSLLKVILDEARINPVEIENAAISSVVPDASRPIAEALFTLLSVEPLMVNSKTDTGIELKTEKPEQVGADLIAGAVAAWHLVKDTCIIVDLGTATTVMVVENPGVFVGGAICNGLKTSVESLIDRTAQLQQIPLEIPPTPIAKNTIYAMQSGLVGGHLLMIEGLISKMIHEIGQAKVVATGGLVSVLFPHTDCFDYVEPTLVLDGLRLIVERHKS